MLGRPIAARKQKQNLAANGGFRYADYEVKPEELCGKGPYVVDVQLIAGMMPANLVNDIQTVGFDYGMSPRQIANNIVAGHLVLHEQSHGRQPTLKFAAQTSGTLMEEFQTRLG